MTTHPVTSGVDLYSTFLQNTYLQASRSSKTPQPSSETSGASANSTARYALRLTVDEAPGQIVAPPATSQSLVAQNNATELQNLATTRQSFIELQQILQDDSEAKPVVRELNGSSQNPMIKFAARLYQSARGSVGSASGDSVGTALNAVA